MDPHAAGFGALALGSDWPDINGLCVQTGVTLKWVQADSGTVAVTEGIITDQLTSVRTTVEYWDSEHRLTSPNAQRLLVDLQRLKQQHWTGLHLHFNLPLTSMVFLY